MNSPLQVKLYNNSVLEISRKIVLGKLGWFKLIEDTKQIKSLDYSCTDHKYIFFKYTQNLKMLMSDTDCQGSRNVQSSKSWLDPKLNLCIQLMQKFTQVLLQILIVALCTFSHTFTWLTVTYCIFSICCTATIAVLLQICCFVSAMIQVAATTWDSKTANANGFATRYSCRGITCSQTGCTTNMFSHY